MEGVVEGEQPPQRGRTAPEDVPDWWPHAAEFPQWYVWRGVCGLVCARRPRTSPPLVVRAENAGQLRAQIRRAEARSTSFEGSGPEPADQELAQAKCVSVLLIRGTGRWRSLPLIGGRSWSCLAGERRLGYCTGCCTLQYRGVPLFRKLRGSRQVHLGCLRGQYATSLREGVQDRRRVSITIC